MSQDLLSAVKLDSTFVDRSVLVLRPVILLSNLVLKVRMLDLVSTKSAFRLGFLAESPIL